MLKLKPFQVLRTALSHRLAKVQGFLFRAAFLRRVPMFVRLIVENLLLCFLQSTLYSTSKYLTGSLGLRFRKILTELIHANYFEVRTVVSFGFSSRWKNLQYWSIQIYRFNVFYTYVSIRINVR